MRANCSALMSFVRSAGMLRHAPTVALSALTLALAVTACGDSTVAGVGGEGTGGFSAVGRVDGFGSTIIDGQRLDDSNARVRIDGVELPLTAIKLGSQLNAAADATRLLQANVEAEVTGPLTADAEDDRVLMVLGQRVLLDAHAALRPVLEASGDLLAGDVVEVHGLRLANGDIVATRVQQRAPTWQEVRLRGPITALDTAMRRFTIGALTVSYANAAVSGAPPAIGRIAVVTANRSALAGRQLTAQRVRVEEVAADGDLRITGFVTQVAPTLQVRGLPLDASAARYLNGASSADLQFDRLLRISGRVSGGMLKAQEIEVLRSAADARVDVTAPVSDFSGADNVFRLRGSTVRINSSTQFVDGSADNLANGVMLRVTGEVVDGVVVAQSLRWIRPGPVVAGSVSGFDADAQTLRLPPLAEPLRLTGATTFRDGTAADIANGRRIRAIGAITGGEFIAREVSFLDAVNAPFTVLLAGVSTDLGPGNRLFVNDTAVVVNAQTSITGGTTGTTADLDGGQFLIVRAQRQGTELIARSIEIRLTLDDDFEHVIGYVSQFTSLTDLRVAGQRVDASTATVSGGSAAQLRDAAYVLIEGSIRQGVLNARRVEILPN
jgi:hypothetical protein